MQSLDVTKTASTYYAYCCTPSVQATPNTVRSRASQDDMRATINKAVTLALQAHHIGVLSDTAADGSAASRSRWGYGCTDGCWVPHGLCPCCMCGWVNSGVTVSAVPLAQAWANDTGKVCLCLVCSAGALSVTGRSETAARHAAAQHPSSSKTCQISCCPCLTISALPQPSLLRSTLHKLPCLPQLLQPAAPATAAVHSMLMQLLAAATAAADLEPEVPEGPRGVFLGAAVDQFLAQWVPVCRLHSCGKCPHRKLAG